MVSKRLIALAMAMILCGVSVQCSRRDDLGEWVPQGGDYYARRVRVKGTPYCITKLLRKKGDTTAVIAENAGTGVSTEYHTFNWCVYGDNIVFVSYAVESGAGHTPHEPLMLYSPRSGYHMLVYDSDRFCAVIGDDKGLLLCPWDSRGNGPDMSRRIEIPRSVLAGDTFGEAIYYPGKAR